MAFEFERNILKQLDPSISVSDLFFSSNHPNNIETIFKGKKFSCPVERAAPFFHILTPFSRLTFFIFLLLPFEQLSIKLITVLQAFNLVSFLTD